MSNSRVLVTGGAGFIGSHIVDLLIEKGHAVRVLDNLTPQVHGERQGRPPDYLNRDAEFVLGDVRDSDALDKALRDIDVVFHEAAAVGVAQSMYEIRSYTDINCLGTATLLDLIVAKHRDHIRKVIVASSMSIYGEGQYVDPRTGAPIRAGLRDPRQMQAGRWEMLVPGADHEARPVPTDEFKPLEPTSVYAVHKRTQEEMVLVTGSAYGIPAVALRYFNVYGPRQALSNPYTGVGAIFCSRYLNGKPPIVFEDGGQSRDFVHVADIARANLLAMERAEADGQAINIGTGAATSVLQIARMLLARLHPGRVDDPELQPRVENKFRAGDIRHCIADIGKARRLLGFEPGVRFEDGIDELIAWVRTQSPVDATDKAYAELASRKLV